MRSREGSPYRSAGRSRSPQREYREDIDITIRFLKKELTSLRSTSKTQLEIRTKLSNLEHRYSMLSSDKNTEYEKSAYRENQVELEICRVEEEVRELRNRIENRERDCLAVRDMYSRVQASVEGVEREVGSLGGRLGLERREIERLERLQEEYENEKGNIMQDALKCDEQTAKNERDIEMLVEQLLKYRRRGKDLRNKLVDTKGEVVSYTKEVARCDQELGGKDVVRKTKETQLERGRARARGVEDEVEAIEKERERMVDAGSERDLVMQGLESYKTELTRREAGLLREKEKVDSEIVAEDRQIGGLRLGVEIIENEVLEREKEYKLLMQVYDRLAADNGKLVERLKDIQRDDGAALKRLERDDTIEDILGGANRQISHVHSILRG